MKLLEVQVQLIKLLERQEDSWGWGNFFKLSSSGKAGKLRGQEKWGMREQDLGCAGSAVGVLGRVTSHP